MDESKSMQAVRQHENGGAETFAVEAVPRPTPRDDELLVAVRATSANPVDAYLGAGEYGDLPLPRIPGVDVAGEVVTVGESVEGYRPGDRVFGSLLAKHHQGAAAEYVAVPRDRVAHLPDGVDAETGAAAGAVAGTAWRAFFERADPQPGETVLIHGGNGGVGHAAVQLAAAAGAHVVTTARPEYEASL
jgi:NADPH:quinone reductase-like Zn-dependent oxidoreductase